MIDPLERWAQYGEKPGYAGLLTFGGVPATQDPAELAGFDVTEVFGVERSALLAERVVREALTGIVVRRRA